MTSMKIGSNVSPVAAQLSNAVERPAVQARPEITVAALPPADEFVTGPSALGTDRLGGPSSLTAPGTLPEALEPFREALDNIASQLSPDLLTDPVKLGQFIMDAIKELGIAGQHFMEAVTYVGELYAYNTGKERLAQAPATTATV